MKKSNSLEESSSFIHIENIININNQIIELSKRISYIKNEIINLNKKKLDNNKIISNYKAINKNYKKLLSVFTMIFFSISLLINITLSTKLPFGILDSLKLQSLLFLPSEIGFLIANKIFNIYLKRKYKNKYFGDKKITYEKMCEIINKKNKQIDDLLLKLEKEKDEKNNLKNIKKEEYKVLKDKIDKLKKGANYLKNIKYEDEEKENEKENEKNTNKVYVKKK